MKGIIFKLKKGKLDTWKAWCLMLDDNLRHEALDTLVEEGLTREYGGVFNMGGEDYGYIFADKEGKPSNKEKEINRTHEATIKECREEGWLYIDTLYSLEV